MNRTIDYVLVAYASASKPSRATVASIRSDLFGPECFLVK